MNHKNERIAKLWERGIRDVETLAKKTGLPQTRIVMGLLHLDLLRTCERCGGTRPLDQSCSCFDNGGQ